MDSSPQLVLEVVLLTLALASFAIQIAAWWWVRSLHKRLGNTDGSALVGIVSFLLGWSLSLRVLGIAMWIAFGVPGAIIGTVVSQLAFFVVMGVVIKRLLALMRS